MWQLVFPYGNQELIVLGEFETFSKASEVRTFLAYHGIIVSVMNKKTQAKVD